MSNQSSIKRADYGIDAPTVIRRFFMIGLVGLIIGTVLVKFGPGHLPDLLVSFYGTFLGIGACFVLQGIVMIWGSKVGKLRLRVVLQRYGTIVMMEACKLFSRRRVEATACAVLPPPGIVG